MLLTFFQVLFISTTKKQTRRCGIKKKKTFVKTSSSDVTTINNNEQNEPKIVSEQLQMQRAEGHRIVCWTQMSIIQ